MTQWEVDSAIDMFESFLDICDVDSSACVYATTDGITRVREGIQGEAPGVLACMVGLIESMAEESEMDFDDILDAIKHKHEKMTILERNTITIEGEEE